MKRRYHIGEYTVEVDKEATHKWYAGAGEWECGCGHCRNFIALAKGRSLPAAVLSLLDALRIPPEKATYVCMSYKDNENLLRYDFSYRLAGRIVSGDARSRGEVACFHETYPHGAPGFPEPHFDLGFLYALPWALEEPEE